MSETPALILALLAGVVLGAIFFGGLWWTVRRGVSSEWPAVWFFGSFLLRTAAALGGFYFVAHGNWRRLVSCLLGFLLARILVAWLARGPIEKRNRVGAGGGP